ncbi:MAG: hypothetical protein ACR2QR_06670 [Woeseiaceae bacterium]
MRLLLYLAIAVLIYYMGRRLWISREADKLTEQLEEHPNQIPYFPKERTYADLTDQQQSQLDAIVPPPSSGTGTRPCRVKLDDGTEYACVFIAPAQEYINSVWKWPEDLANDDGDFGPVDIERVVHIAESLYRVPPPLARQIKALDIEDHGGMRFVAEFPNGDRWRYQLNDCVEFLTAPAGMTFADVVAIHPQDENSWKLPKGRALAFRWCLYGHGIPRPNIRIWKRM